MASLFYNKVVIVHKHYIRKDDYMNTNRTDIIFLLDRSGSMSGLEGQTIKGFNQFVEKQGTYPGETYVTCVLFDDTYEVLWKTKPVKGLHLTDEDYYVRGCTALLDAIGKSIIDTGYEYARLAESKRPNKVIMVITTDGLENASKEYTYKKIKELIKHQEDKYQWEFIFMGANIDVEVETQRLGIKKDNAFVYEASEKGMPGMYKMASASVAKCRKS